MDPLFQVALSALTVIVAASVAVVVGRSKGLAAVEAKGDAEMARLVSALEGRTRVLEADLDAANKLVALLRAEVVTLTAQVAGLKLELETEQRITKRLTLAADK